MPLIEWVRPTKTNYSDVVEKNLGENENTLPSAQTITDEDIKEFWKIANSRIEYGKYETLISKLKNTYTVKDIYILMIIYPPQNRFRYGYIIQNFENNKINTELLKNIIKASAIFIKSAQNLCEFYELQLKNIISKSKDKTATKIWNCLNNTELENNKDLNVPELLKTILECTLEKYNKIYNNEDSDIQKIDEYQVKQDAEGLKKLLTYILYNKPNNIEIKKDSDIQKIDEYQVKQDAEGLKKLLTLIRDNELNNIKIIKENYNQLINIMLKIGIIADIIWRIGITETLEKE